MVDVGQQYKKNGYHDYRIMGILLIRKEEKLNHSALKVQRLKQRMKLFVMLNEMKHLANLQARFFAALKMTKKLKFL